MNKQEILSILQDKSRELAELLANIAASPSLREPGRLVSRKVNGKTRLYERNSGTESYLGSDDKKKVILLATKSYAIKLEKVAKLQKKQMDDCIALLESELDDSGTDLADVDLVYGRLPGHIKENTIPSSITDDSFAEKWQKEKYNTMGTKKGSTTFETPRGEKVRSKSEWIIASMLAEAGVPYRYEELVPLNADVMVFLHPDFTVLNKRTRKVYYWEHFGRMNDPDYVENSFMPKILDYYNFNFLPGEKLLMTFESSGSQLDTTQVKRLIEQFLV